MTHKTVSSLRIIAHNTQNMPDEANEKASIKIQLRLQRRPRDHTDDLLMKANISRARERCNMMKLRSHDEI